LGVDRKVELHDVTVTLAAGDALVTFTGGIVERHQGRRFLVDDGVAAVMAVVVVRVLGPSCGRGGGA
jgi:serine phosphatase RsbU (regulator of sigma subunit)